jgi:hypothetical protein
MHPSHAGQTVPTIVLWTVFQVIVLHILDGSIFALQLVVLSPSTTTQTVPYAWGKTAIMSLSAVYVSAVS